MSQTQQMKAQADYNTTQVLWLTGMTAQQYNEFQIDTARAWIDRYWSAVYGDALIGCTLFWKWWMFTWSNADDSIILPELYHIPKTGRFCQYRAMHQYIFNEANEEHQWLMQEFRDLRADFDKELKAINDANSIKL